MGLFSKLFKKTTTDMTFDKVAPGDKMTLENQNGMITGFDRTMLEKYLYDMFRDSNQFVTLTLTNADYGIRYIQACRLQKGISIQLGIEENGRTKLVEKVVEQEECLDVFRTFYETGFVYRQEEYHPLEMMKR